MAVIACLLASSSFALPFAPLPPSRSDAIAETGADDPTPGEPPEELIVVDIQWLADPDLAADLRAQTRGGMGPGDPDAGALRIGFLQLPYKPPKFLG